MSAPILIVQSDPAVRDLMALALQRAGYSVQTAADLRQALPALRADAPRLALLDLFLSDSVGLDSLAIVRKAVQGANTLVMVTSSLCFREIVQVAAKAGACDFLAKPVDPGDLVRRVSKALATQTVTQPAHAVECMPASAGQGLTDAVAFS